MTVMSHYRSRHAARVQARRGVAYMLAKQRRLRRVERGRRHRAFVAALWHATAWQARVALIGGMVALGLAIDLIKALTS